MLTGHWHTLASWMADVMAGRADPSKYSVARRSLGAEAHGLVLLFSYDELLRDPCRASGGSVSQLQEVNAVGIRHVKLLTVRSAALVGTLLCDAHKAFTAGVLCTFMLGVLSAQALLYHGFPVRLGQTFVEGYRHHLSMACSSSECGKCRKQPH